MPNYKGHLVGGAIACTFVIVLIHQYIYATMPMIMKWFLFALLGSLFPDIDIKSKGQKYFYLGIACLSFYLLSIRKFYLLSFVIIGSFFPLMVRHRGITHTVGFLLIVSVGMIVSVKFSFGSHPPITPVDGLFFFIGGLSHILLDHFF